MVVCKKDYIQTLNILMPQVKLKFCHTRGGGGWGCSSEWSKPLLLRDTNNEKKNPPPPPRPGQS